jgi:hypothetical protein
MNVKGPEENVEGGMGSKFASTIGSTKPLVDWTKAAREDSAQTASRQANATSKTIREG